MYNFWYCQVIPRRARVFHLTETGSATVRIREQFSIVPLLADVQTVGTKPRTALQQEDDDQKAHGAETVALKNLPNTGGQWAILAQLIGRNEEGSAVTAVAPLENQGRLMESRCKRRISLPLPNVTVKRVGRLGNRWRHVATAHALNVLQSEVGSESAQPNPLENLLWRPTNPRNGKMPPTPWSPDAITVGRWRRSSQKNASQIQLIKASEVESVAVPPNPQLGIRGLERPSVERLPMDLLPDQSPESRVGRGKGGDAIPLLRKPVILKSRFALLHYLLVYRFEFDLCLGDNQSPKPPSGFHGPPAFDQEKPATTETGEPSKSDQ